MKKKKSRKKLVIGVGVLIVAVVAGVNIYGSMNAADSAIPQVKTVSAVRDNVQQTVATMNQMAASVKQNSATASAADKLSITASNAAV